ncbi:MAG: hypothetical protein ABEJ56_07120 [Candidatus Nanohaloarchaea archaeon]
MVESEVTSEVRRRIKPFYDDKGKFISKFYAAALFYLLRDSIEEVYEVVMEEEYEGKMAHIVNITCCWIRDIHGSEADTAKFTIQPRQPDFHPDILAKKVLRKEVEPDWKLDFSDFSDLL